MSEQVLSLAAGQNVAAPSGPWTIGLRVRSGLDVDLCALLVGEDGKVAGDDDFVFYNAPRHVSGAVTLTGDPSSATLRIDPGAVTAGAGMQRLVASDQIENVTRHLDKRLTLSADGVRYDEFVDARAHVTDHLHSDGVRSSPLSIDEVKRAAKSPKQWADRQVAAAATRQIGTAAASGAAAGGVISGVVEAGAQAARVRAGETSVAAAACGAAGAAARGAVSSGAIAGLGETVRVAATASLLPAGFGVGTLLPVRRRVEWCGRWRRGDNVWSRPRSMGLP